MVSRRNFIKGVSGAAAAAGGLHPFLSWAIDNRPGGADANVVIPGSAGMILRSQRFLDLEMPPDFVDSWLTPVPHFFVRNHMHEPSTLEASEWTLTISGEVEKPLVLRLADLSKIDSHGVVNTLECAGNGRGLQRPRVPGIQWGKGAVGNARFSGPRLRDLLERAGVKPAGKHVSFHGLDDVPGKVPPFIRSIPIEKATDADTLVALRMNGAELTKDHGFPARSLVPGWIGSASVKWLSEIKVLDKEFEGNFMKPAYRWPNHPLKPGEAVNPEDTHALTSLTVTSMIATPADASTLKSRKVHVTGAAWAGEADITKVEVSADGGAAWRPAKLGGEQAKYAWRLWSMQWKAPGPGDYTLLSRATDSQGRVQPTVAEWNPSGYLYNAIDQVNIHVA
jgi:DMSO/TMAO reductase YedYZ molybdopterin-dependent catalytic subunit